MGGVRSGGVGLGLVVEGGDGAEGVVARWVRWWGEGVVERVVEVVMNVQGVVLVGVQGGGLIRRRRRLRRR